MIIAKKNDYIISMLVAFSLAYYPVTYAINEIVNKYIQYGAWWDTAVCLGVYASIVLCSIPIIIKRISMVSIALLFLFLFIFICNIYLDYKASPIVADRITQFFTLFFPFIFLGEAITDFENLDYVLDKTTKIVLVAAVIWIGIIVFGVNRGQRIAYMNISYFVLPSSLLRIYYFFRHRNIENFVYALLALSCQIIWGTRGPVLILLVFVAMCFLKKDKSLNKIVGFTIVALLVLLSFALFQSAIDYLSDLFLDHDLVNGGLIKLYEVDWTDGRADLIGETSQHIFDHPLTGEGLYYDRVLFESYVHFLPLEFVLDFGLLLGSIFLFLIIVYYKKACKSVIDFDDFRWPILQVSFCLGGLKLLLSGSYLEEFYFFFFLGLMINRSYSLKKEVTEQKQNPSSDLSFNYSH